MSSCLFCEIAAGRIPCDAVASDDDFVAFRDIDPKAPSHLLVIPRRHISGLNDLTPADADLAGLILLAAVRVAANEGLAPGGYRLVVNSGRDAGQTVDHLHVHVLGGRSLAWPPG